MYIVYVRPLSSFTSARNNSLLGERRQKMTDKLSASSSSAASAVATATLPIPPQEDNGQFGNPMLRWTIFYAFVIFALTTMPLWLSAITNHVVYVNTAFIALFSLLWIAIAVNAVLNFRVMEKVRTPTLAALKASRVRQFKHVVIVPCFIDPIEVLFDALGSLLLQADLSNLVVVVAFEAKTPDLADKIHTVKTAFDGRFGDFLISVHTLDRSREIAGGCSNKNYALRFAHRYLRDELKCLGGGAASDAVSVTLTTCDTDSLFHPNYFTVLEQEYNCHNPTIGAPPRMMVFQPPLFYNWNLDERPFFNRITGLMRSMMMLGGLISFNLNPMSIFSYPLELGLTAGFINPRYGVDDIIAKVRWMCDTNEKVPVVMLPIPVISGPTIGTSFFNEVEEWARQIRRWIVGSSESFHYFVIHFRGRPFLAGVQWFFMFFIYYAVLLCSAGIFSMLAGIPWPWVDYPTYEIYSSSSSSSHNGTSSSSPDDRHDPIRVTFSLSQIGLVALGVQYLVFGVAFLIDARATRMLTVKEDIHFLRNVLHWVLAPPTLLVYSMIAFWAIIKFVFVGKKMARHDMAAKDGLLSVTAAAAAAAPSSSSPTGHHHRQQQEQPLLFGGGDNNGVESGRDKDDDEQSMQGGSVYGGCCATAINNNDEEEGDTSCKKDAAHVVDVVASSPPASLPHPPVLLCQLPASFSFGAYTVSTADITYRRPL